MSMHCKEMIAVIEAYMRGEAVEVSRKGQAKPEWRGIIEPRFNFDDFDYRIKPTPKRKVTLYQYLMQGIDQGHPFYYLTGHTAMDYTDVSNMVRRLDHTAIEVEVE